MKYLWNESVSAESRPKFERASGEYKTDVLVIGGGMAGILIANRLREIGANYMLVEASSIGSGTTVGTTAVLTAQHDTLYTEIKQSFDTDTAKLYLHANLKAVEAFHELSERVSCDFEYKPSFMVTRESTEAKELKKEAALVKKLGFDAKFRHSTELPYRIAGAVKYDGMAQMNPMKLLYGLAKGMNIYENTFIHTVEGNTAYSDEAVIQADSIVIATHFPFINAHGMYFMKLYQNRSFVIAYENAEQLEGTYVDMEKGGIYLRNYGKLLLVGGGDHRTGKYKKGFGFERVRAFAKECFPRAREKYAWATQDCMSLDGVPYIGRYSSNTPNLYVATGFNEWGMTSSMVASWIIEDMILNRHNEYEEVFDPSRSVLRKQLFVNLGETLVNFLTPTTKRCPHLGCALKWNKWEHTWDCPCHGSRFEESGHLICNPAMKPIKNSRAGRGN